MKRAERAFTLLEVLAAIALLAILYTTLAGKAIQGLRSEGESRRRLEASLLVDAKLFEIESQIDVGLPPALGETEEEQDPFTIVTKVEPFELPELPEPEVPLPEDAQSLFDVEDPEDSPVRVVEIVVRWNEGLAEREVVRTTYALDSAAVTAALGGTSGAGASGASGADPLAGLVDEEGNVDFDGLIEQLQGGGGGP